MFHVGRKMGTVSGMAVGDVHRPGAYGARAYVETLPGTPFVWSVCEVCGVAVLVVAPEPGGVVRPGLCEPDGRLRHGASVAYYGSPEAVAAGSGRPWPGRLNRSGSAGWARRKVSLVRLAPLHVERARWWDVSIDGWIPSSMERLIMRSAKGGWTSRIATHAGPWMDSYGKWGKVRYKYATVAFTRERPLTRALAQWRARPADEPVWKWVTGLVGPVPTKLTGTQFYSWIGRAPARPEVGRR